MALALWNVITFYLCGLDKLKAKKGSWRISERTLLLCAAAFGAPGLYVGMKVFRHKTQKKKFFLVPLFLMLQLCLVIWLLMR